MKKDNPKLYNTEEKKRKFLKKGNIITFKHPFYPFGTFNGSRKQIIVNRVHKDRSNAVKIEGSGYDSSWYENMNSLFEAIDWDWMEKAHSK